MATVRKPWSRDELLVAFNAYCRIPFGRLNKSNSEIVKLSRMLGRTPSAVSMKLCNFASFDLWGYGLNRECLLDLYQHLL